MPKGKFVGNEGTIALRGVVRDGKLVGIIDHEEKERGIALVDIDKVTGGLELSAAGRTLKQTAAKLVSAYEATLTDNAVRGHFLEPRAGLSAADTPTISGSGTAPASDGTDPATQRISLFGSDLTGSAELTLAQALPGKKWIRGFSPGAFNWGQASVYRLSSSVNTYNVNGNQDKRPSDNYGYDAGLIYLDLVVDSDVFYLRVLTGHKFALWVNDNLVGATATLGANVTYDATNILFSPAIGGHGYTKIKFTTVARRTIRVAFWGASSIGDVWTRSISTVTPRSASPIEWVHFGDSFSDYTAAPAIPYRAALSEYMSSAFGRNVNFVNVSKGSTSFANPALNSYGEAPTAVKADYYLQYLLHWQHCAPQVVSFLTGHNDTGYTIDALSPKVVELLQAIRAKWPGVLIIGFTTNASPGLISAGTDLTVEANMISAINTAGVDAHVIPMQSSANPYGALIRGTGKVGATTGVGNSDLYIGTDGTHPSEAGHKAIGLWMAERMYEVLRDNYLE